VKGGPISFGTIYKDDEVQEPLIYVLHVSKIMIEPKIKIDKAKENGDVLAKSTIDKAIIIPHKTSICSSPSTQLSFVKLKDKNN